MADERTQPGNYGQWEFEMASRVPAYQTQFGTTSMRLRRIANWPWPPN
jgi:hypothetical protein